MVRRSVVAAVAALGLISAGMIGVATSASASVADPVVTGVVQGPTGVALDDLEVDFCAGACSAASEYTFTNANGAFSDDIDAGASGLGVVPGTYKLALFYLDQEPTTALGVDPTYVPEAGYLQQSGAGTYLITDDPAAATNFTINATDTDLGTIKLAPFVGSTTAATYYWKSAGTYGATCPGYAVTITLPTFPAGATISVTAYAQASATATSSTAVWSTTLSAGTARPVITYTPSAALAGKYVQLGIVVSKPGYNSWSGATALKPVYSNTCSVPTSAVKAWSKKSGKVKAGKTVKLSATSFRQSGLKATYTWKVNGKAVKKGTARSLKLKSTWKGKKLTVVITVTGGGNRSITKTLNLGKIA